MRKSFIRSTTKGFTLVELLIALAVIGAAVIALIGLGVNSFNQSKVQTEFKNLQAISSAVKGSFGATGSYSGLTVSLVQNAGGFPSQMIVNGVPTNSWGGTVSVAQSVIGTTGYDITYTKVPQSSCINLASQSLSSFVNISINGSTNATTSWTTTSVGAACVNGDNDIIFNGV